MEQLAYKIRFFRNENKWTQQELAEKLSISRSVIAKWESNKTVPDAISLYKLSELFNVSTDYLIGKPPTREAVLKDFIPMYTTSNSTNMNTNLIELVDYLITHPNLVNDLTRLKELSIKKQKSIEKLFTQIIHEYELM